MEPTEAKHMGGQYTNGGNTLCHVSHLNADEYVAHLPESES